MPQAIVSTSKDREYMNSLWNSEIAWGTVRTLDVKMYHHCSLEHTF